MMQLNCASASETSSTAELVETGIRYARAGRFNEAVASYKKALQEDPRCIAAQVNLGLAYFKTGQFESAVTPLEAAADEGLDSDQVHTLLGMSLFSLKRYSSAATHFNILFARQPENQMLQYFLAESYVRSSATRELAGLFDVLQARSPNSPVAHMLAGERYDEMNRTEDAISEFKRAVQNAPEFPFLHFGLGYFYWEERRFDQAEQEFLTETRIPNGEAEHAKGYLADIALRNGDLSKAENLVRDALRGDAAVRIAHYDFGVILAGQNKPNEAKHEFSEAIRLDPARPDAYYRLAKIYLQLGDRKHSGELLAKVSQIHSSQYQPLTKSLSAAASSK
jgi:tetratricopeptide (TPR) repeat protein